MLVYMCGYMWFENRFLALAIELKADSALLWY
jgi:hypothetical protein